MKTPLSIIRTEVEKAFQLKKGSLASPSREHAIAEARHCYWLLACYAGYPLPAIADSINRHRASSYNSITRAIELCINYREYRATVQQLHKTLRYEKETERIPSRIALYRCAVDAIL